MSHLSVAEKISIPRANKPEDVGVSSKAVVGFLRDIEECGAEIHSFMVIRHGKVAAECFRFPFGPDRPHQMYSISKTFTATAIGFAVCEGFISLDTKVRDIFPEYTKDISDSQLDMLTVHHLLCMTSGKNVSVISDKGKIDWIENFFKAPWYADPGSKFMYINENIYMLSAIIYKATGMFMRDFLQPRLFEPLGIDYPFWETDQNGIEAGGWGLYIKTEDLAKLMLCYSEGGKFQGKQVIPEEWVKLATAVQSDNSESETFDNSFGYGYCIWHNGGCKESYRADGMFSQFGIVFYEHDAVLSVTGAIADEQYARDIIWRHFPAAFIDENAEAKEDTSVPDLKEILANSPIDAPQPSARCSVEEQIDGKTIKVRKKILLNIVGFPVSVLPLAITYMTTDKAGNIDDIVFNFGENECSMKWTEGDEDNTIICGMDGHFRYGVMRLGQIDYTVCCNAEWCNNNELMVNIRPVNAIAKRLLKFTFNANGRVAILPRSTPTVAAIGEVLAAGSKDFLGSDTLVFLFRKIIKFLPPIVEPKLKGRIVR